MIYEENEELASGMFMFAGCEKLLSKNNRHEANEPGPSHEQKRRRSAERKQWRGDPQRKIIWLLRGGGGRN